MEEKIFTKKRKPIKWRAVLFRIAFLAIPTINLIVFYFGVNFNSILMAFQRTIPGGETQWSLYNFQKLFMEGFGGVEPIMLESLCNTLIFFCFAFFVTNPLNLIFAYFFYKKIKGYKAYRFIFYLPCIIPGVVLSTLFRYIIAPDANGVIATILMNFGVQMPDLLGSSEYAMKTLLVYNFWTAFTTNLILFASAMNRIPQEIIESAKLDGVNEFQEVIHIIVPLIWPTISTVLLLAVMDVFTASGPILLFTKGDYGTYTISYWLFEQVLQGTNLEYSAAVGLFFTIAGLPIVFVSRWLTGKINEVEY